MNPKIRWNVISLNEAGAIASYQRYNGDVKFHVTDHPHVSEHESVFSRAIAKFQHLVIFEDA